MNNSLAQPQSLSISPITMCGIAPTSNDVTEPLVTQAQDLSVAQANSLSVAQPHSLSISPITMCGIAPTSNDAPEP